MGSKERLRRSRGSRTFATIRMGMYNSIQKWDQRSFNVNFAIIMGHHVSSLVIPLAYYPSIATCIGAYVHFGGLCGLLINTICVDEKEPGKGGRTLGNRILWISICNLTQLCAFAISFSSQPVHMESLRFYLDRCLTHLLFHFFWKLTIK